MSEMSTNYRNGMEFDKYVILGIPFSTYERCLFVTINASAMEILQILGIIY